MIEKNQMRILLIHRYFWPDTSPYGILLRRIAEHLAAVGNQVSVFSGEPTYNTLAEGVPRQEKLSDRLSVSRVKLFSEKRIRPLFRLLNDLIFCLRIVAHIIRHKPQVVMCSTQPPVIGAFVAGWASRRVGAKFVYHLQDVYPEVICETGHVRQSLPMRVLKAIDLRTVRNADRAVVLSNDMLDTMIHRSGSATEQVSVIPNMNLPRFDDLQSPPDAWVKEPGVFRLMFAGNIGRFQNLDILVDACLRVPAEKPFELVLMGDGKAKEGLRQRASRDKTDRIKFIDRQPLAIAEPLMADADLCVVSLEERVFRYAFPSKLASYLSLGAPVLVVCEPESELSKLPLANGFGLSCAQTPAEGILAQIVYAIDHPDEVASMREQAAKFFHDHFSPDQVLPQWSDLFTEICKRPQAR